MPFRLHALDHHVPDQVLVPRMSDLPLHAFARGKGLAFELHAKPLAKLFCIR
jgi:hypothetical protein